MANEYKLSYTASEIDEKLGKVDKTVLCTEQALTPEQQAQARANIGACDASILETVIVSVSHNILNHKELTSGYISLGGKISESSILAYTKPISVKEGDVIRIYQDSNHSTLELYDSRFVTAYKDGVANADLGGQNVRVYTVPANVDSIVVTLNPSVIDMITKNYEATVYEPYGDSEIVTKVKESALPIASETSFGLVKVWTTVVDGETVLNISTEE